MRKPHQVPLPDFLEQVEEVILPASAPVLDAPVLVVEVLPGVILVVRLQLYTEATGVGGEGAVK